MVRMGDRADEEVSYFMATSGLQGCGMVSGHLRPLRFPAIVHSETRAAGSGRLRPRTASSRPLPPGQHAAGGGPRAVGRQKVCEDGLGSRLSGGRARARGFRLARERQ